MRKKNALQNAQKDLQDILIMSCEIKITNSLSTSIKDQLFTIDPDKSIKGFKKHYVNLKSF
jgi:hypothetical protein